MAAFTAFCERHYEPYVQYAALRIGQHGAAEAAVAAAFTELAVSWTAVLGSPGPAAVAWGILQDHVDHALGQRRRTAPHSRAAHTLRQDAQLLYGQMQLSSERVAEVLGVLPSDVPSLLPPATAAKE
ncbi:hypothetical protein ACWD25_23270 [Streptomyces sp. NPDC002920]